MSDGEYLLSEMRETGYWSTSACLDGLEYGSPVSRIRAWWGGIEGIPTSGRLASEAEYFFTRLLKAFKLAEPTPITEVLVKCPEARKEYAEHIGVAELAGTGLRQPKIR